MIEISVIIPTFGKPLFLKKSITSVLCQTFNSIELIVVDDNDPKTCARKQTERILEQIMSNDSRVKYIKHERNMNGAVARNTGLTVAQGKYISFLDSDDIYMPERLQKCYNLMEGAPTSVAGVYTGCEFRRRGKTYLKYTDVKYGNYLVSTLACTFMLCTGSNIFVRKSVVDELNGFDPMFLRQQDYEFMVRIFENYTFEAIPELLVIKNNENYNLPNIEKVIAIRNQYLDKFKYIIDDLSQQDKKYIYHSNYINIAEIALAQNRYKIANDYYSKASDYIHLSKREWFRRIVLPIYNIIKHK